MRNLMIDLAIFYRTMFFFFDKFKVFFSPLLLIHIWYPFGCLENNWKKRKENEKIRINEKEVDLQKKYKSCLG